MTELTDIMHALLKHNEQLIEQSRLYHAHVVESIPNGGYELMSEGEFFLNVYLPQFHWSKRDVAALQRVNPSAAYKE